MNAIPYNKILIIDDNSANLKLLMEILTFKGYIAYPAVSGELALEFVKSTLPDLILLDIRMPGMDGFEVCQKLKSDPSTQSIPIIFLSALEDVSDKVKAFQAGGVDYITKPFEQEELLARVAIQIRVRELTEGLEQEVSARTVKLRMANKKLQEEILQRKDIEEALRESRQRLGNIVFNSPGAIYRRANDENWTMEFISAAITAISGYNSEDLLHNQLRSFASTIHPDDRVRVSEEVTQGLANNRRYEVGFRLLAADGSEHWIHDQGLGVYDDNGKLLYLDGVLIDNTVQRNAEEMQRLNAERMETLLHLYEMSGSSKDDIMQYAYESAIRLTRSKIGYLGFINEEETQLDVLYWSKEAMEQCAITGETQVFPLETAGLWGEAVRQRRPIITNDYRAANPHKRGTPEGHIALVRHMNLPVIVDDKIVLVAGVGNKETDYTEDDVKQLQLLMEGMWRLIERGH